MNHDDSDDGDNDNTNNVANLQPKQKRRVPERLSMSSANNCRCEHRKLFNLPLQNSSTVTAARMGFFSAKCPFAASKGDI